MPVTFDAGDVDLMVSAIERRPNMTTAIRAAQSSAHKADLDADFAEYYDGNHPRAAYYRDYARAVRLACRIAAWAAYEPPPPQRPGQAPRIDAAEVKARVDLVSYIGQHTQLKKKGAQRFEGLCPFHDDHKPSMSVWTDGRWHCFGIGCGVGGDVFTFVMLRDRVSFSEALRTVIQEAGCHY